MYNNDQNDPSSNGWFGPDDKQEENLFKRGLGALFSNPQTNETQSETEQQTNTLETISDMINSLKGMFNIQEPRNSEINLEIHQIRDNISNMISQSASIVKSNQLKSLVTSSMEFYGLIKDIERNRNGNSHSQN